MSLITLLTDFGIRDEYVGLMKGVVLSIFPSAVVVDITHQIEPQDIVQAAYTIKSSYRYFPTGTVHLIVIDPGVGGDRDIIAMKSKGHVFIAPDNGVLSLICDAGKIESIIRIDNATFFLKSIGQTFHGRDIIAPVGAHIAKGAPLNTIGSEIGLMNILRLKDLSAAISPAGELVGTIISIDRFGNLITNIDFKQLDDYARCGRDEIPQFWIGEKVVHGLSTAYINVEQQCPLAIIGSRGYLEIAVNRGSAQRYFSVNKGDMVKVTI
jgi:S-adenosylmethionine hydrolase